MQTAPELSTQLLTAHIFANAYDGALITTSIGSLHCIRLNKDSEPERLGWYARHPSDNGPTGNAWADVRQAAADLLAWHQGEASTMGEVVYLKSAKR